MYCQCWLYVGETLTMSAKLYQRFSNNEKLTYWPRYLVRYIIYILFLFVCFLLFCLFPYSLYSFCLFLTIIYLLCFKFRGKVVDLHSAIRILIFYVDILSRQLLLLLLLKCANMLRLRNPQWRKILVFKTVSSQNVLNWAPHSKQVCDKS